MSADLVIDIDACHQGASDLAELAEEMDQAATAVKSESEGNFKTYDGYRVGAVHEARRVLFHLKLRTHRRSLLIDDLSQFIETNTLLVEEADESASVDIEQIGDGLLSLSETVYNTKTLDGGEYTSSDYYELTGAEPPVSSAGDGEPHL